MQFNSGRYLVLFGHAFKKSWKLKCSPDIFHKSSWRYLFSWGQFYFSTAVSKCTNSPEAEDLQQFKNVKSVINITEISHRVSRLEMTFKKKVDKMRQTVVAWFTASFSRCVAILLALTNFFPNAAAEGYNAMCILYIMFTLGSYYFKKSCFIGFLGHSQLFRKTDHIRELHFRQTGLIHSLKIAQMKGFPQWNASEFSFSTFLWALFFDLLVTDCTRTLKSIVRLKPIHCLNSAKNFLYRR